MCYIRNELFTFLKFHPNNKFRVLVCNPHMLLIHHPSCNTNSFQLIGKRLFQPLHNTISFVFVDGWEQKCSPIFLYLLRFSRQNFLRKNLEWNFSLMEFFRDVEGWGKFPTPTHMYNPLGSIPKLFNSQFSSSNRFHGKHGSNYNFNLLTLTYITSWQNTRT